MTTLEARDGGIAGWGFPKFVADMDFAEDPGFRRVRLSEGGSPILTLTVHPRAGAGRPAAPGRLHGAARRATRDRDTGPRPHAGPVRRRRIAAGRPRGGPAAASTAARIVRRWRFSPILTTAASFRPGSRSARPGTTTATPVLTGRSAGSRSATRIHRRLTSTPPRCRHSDDADAKPCNRSAPRHTDKGRYAPVRIWCESNTWKRRFGDLVPGGAAGSYAPLFSLGRLASRTGICIGIRRVRRGETSTAGPESLSRRTRPVSALLSRAQ